VNRAQRNARRRRQKQAYKEHVARIALLNAFVDDLQWRQLMYRLHNFTKNLRISQDGDVITITGSIMLSPIPYIQITLTV